MKTAFPKVAFGSTLLDRGLHSGGLDGIGQYCQELLNQYSLNPTEFEIQAFSFGTNKTYCSATILPSYPSYLAKSFLSANQETTARQFFADVDVIHATDQLIPIRHNKPMVSTVMDTIPLSHPQFLRSHSRYLKPFLWKKLTQQSDHIITISEFSKKEISRLMHFPLEKITSIPLGVDSRYFEKIANEDIQNTLNRFSIHTPFFLFIGSIQPRKNLLRLLKAHASLPQKLATEFPLVIAGKLAWDDGQTLKEIHKGVDEKRCIWLDYISDFDKRCLLQASQGMVFASLYEGFGLPILEAFASNTPVITSNCTSMPEVAGDDALLVDPNNVESIREALLSLIHNSSLVTSLKFKGLSQAKKFTWELVANRTLDVYRSLL
ncbi:glycosyltransferase family 4 protein [Polynucleobacter sp. 15G-AUS-farblos]|uniref:glycosyltransferase family 4 protein n=1 Tax=Polynucleobacter sp. 15G-AUS-farblos TaxID=2689094 RepID=UPI001C0D8580|nr:glycosyltransferase family 1 protein [Polynucleobacter sp. 15G-AUS-farblos]MBU3583738.1 glycosyltransferase family 4 protein [Polynucleobacter sp. 15G-AUS-farblos]